MSYQTVRDVLQGVRHHYRVINQALDTADGIASEDESEAAVAAIRADEERVASALNEERTDGPSQDQFLKTWLQYIPDDGVKEAAKKFCKQVDDPSNYADLKSAKLEFDEEMAKFFSTLTEQVVAPTARERMESLANYFTTRAQQDAWGARDT